MSSAPAASSSRERAVGRGGVKRASSRFARALPAEGSSSAAGAGGDDLAFDAVVRLSGGTRVGSADGGSAGDDAGTAGTAFDSRTAIERVTLGLASADEYAIAIRDARLECSAPSSDAVNASVCDLEQRLSEGDGVALRRLAATACRRSGCIAN